MHLDQYPDKFKVLPPLCDMIGIAEESRSVVLSAVWKFIKTVGAQDKDDVTKLLPVGGLQKVYDLRQTSEGQLAKIFALNRSWTRKTRNCLSTCSPNL